MNRRALAWVSAVVLAIAAGAWWLSSAEVPGVQPLSPAPEVGAPPAPLPRAATPVSPPPAVDAGPRLAELEIELVRDGQRVVGARVELEGPGGPVSRPTDVMGFARFTVQEGAWRATGLLGASSTDVEVRAPFTRLRLEVPRSERLSGRVVDELGSPVSGAEVAGEISGREGTFSVETFGAAVQVQARLGDRRSVPRVAKAPGPVELMLQAWTRLRVEVSGPGNGLTLVRVVQGDQVIVADRNEEPFAVPVGKLEVLARRNVKGRIFTGRTSVMVEAGKENEAQVLLSVSKPLRGRLLTAAGAGVAGLTVEASELDLSKGAQRADGGTEWDVISRSSAMTNHLGEFNLTPSLTNSIDPVYRLEVGGLWQATRLVLVRIDDAPVEIEIVQAQR